MELLKNPYIAATVVIACIVVFYLDNTSNFFGKFINRFSPCIENPTHSAPCYLGHDISLMIFVAVIGFVFTLILIFDIYKMFKG